MAQFDIRAQRKALLDSLRKATSVDTPGLLQRLRRPPEAAATADQLALLDKLVRRSIRRERELQATLKQLEDEMFVLAKRLRKTESGLRALLRHELETLSKGGPDPLDLDAQRFSLLSQNEEDGYTLALLRHCGAPNRSFVEFGSGRTGGNSGLLARTAKWRGLMVDANEAAVAVAAARFGATGRIRVVSAFVTPDNVDPLIEEAGLAGDVDLFSLDIDSFDYWVLQAMSACRPRLMILEYNDRFGPNARVTVPLGSEQLDRRRNYFGASLSAMTALAHEKGYRLITCDRSGTNAFFVRHDLAPGLPTLSPAEAYRENASRRSAPSGEAFLDSLRADGLALVEV